MISIRPAVFNDLEALYSMDHLAQDDPERRNLILNAVVDRTCYVATCGSELIAYAVLNSAFYRQGWIDLVYVCEGHRRKGTGKALLEYLEGECRTAKLFTSTNESNLPMRHLLTRLGYVVSGIINNLDQDDPEIVYFKQRR